ncbi:MAG: radical SAM protein [Epsilonproteobacteria bacterium]|nr:MAG: radical SAM protein [Campylobacterota bacterium]RLA67252.1 MAG: radical SAM protein [Campylobacterota bacterium]
MKNKFSNRSTTLDGKPRAYVEFNSPNTIWFNTGTLCNLACSNCYIESSPKNDRLAYLNRDDVTPYLDEISDHNWQLESIGLTGGEPFLNPHIFEILDDILKRGHQVLVLTNAYRVIKRWEKDLLRLKNTYNEQLKLRISMDHYTHAVHDRERGEQTLKETLKSFSWLSQMGFQVSIAGRYLINESYEKALKGYQELLIDSKIPLILNSDNLIMFPEMKDGEDVPEISTACWDILKIRPADQMCASQRMIVKVKGEDSPKVQACTLLAYDQNFTMGKGLNESFRPVFLNHEFCAKFCVLGGANCGG